MPSNSRFGQYSQNVLFLPIFWHLNTNTVSSGEEEGSAVENLDNFVAKRSAVLPETSSQEEEDTSQNREAILRGNVRSQEFSTEDLIRAGSESQGGFILDIVMI